MKKASPFQFAPYSSSQCLTTLSKSVRRWPAAFCCRHRIIRLAFLWSLSILVTITSTMVNASIQPYRLSPNDLENNHWSANLLTTHYLSTTLSFATPTSMSSSTHLNDASNLIDIAPAQTRLIILTYLSQQTLSEQQLSQPLLSNQPVSNQQDKSSSTVLREEIEQRTRAVANTIKALSIIAQAEFNLGNSRSAFDYLNQALSLAQTHHQPYVELDLERLKVALLWRSNGDAKKAAAQLDIIEQRFPQTTPITSNFEQSIRYNILILRAKIALNTYLSENNEEYLLQANQFYQQARLYVEQSRSTKIIINYHLQLGEFYLLTHQYDLSLTELLFSYWQSIEHYSNIQLAHANNLLAQLFVERDVLDKAIEHYTQAADFYDNYSNSPLLAPILKSMANIYYQQEKYNLALVYYLNLLDIDNHTPSINESINIHLNLAVTYFQLFNYPASEQYLERARELLDYTQQSYYQIFADLLAAELHYVQQQIELSINEANNALTLATATNNRILQQRAHQQLALNYETLQQYHQALIHYQQAELLDLEQQTKRNQQNEASFKQQKYFIEQNLHLLDQSKQLQNTTNQYKKFQQLTFILSALLLIFIIVIFRRGYRIKHLAQHNRSLSSDLYTHTRSGLRNLRMLNARLPFSLEKSRQHFERWKMGELINEPLHDRLRFVMIDLPFLRNMYLQHGYQAGLELEKHFGEYLKSTIVKPARLYHFSDANLLYIQPNSDLSESPQALFDKVQQWLIMFAETELQHQEIKQEDALGSKNKNDQLLFNHIIRMGIADYPFLPRAYTAINDHELLDILLLATHLACQVSNLNTSNNHNDESQWVYLRAIEHAPAASLATKDIRHACTIAIKQGLIKIHSSSPINEELLKSLL